ncbi:MAG: hypothetical protein QOG45_1347 [Chloroflexota bacterium]|nr:hypothetical protein [Chloroflexota bacterium]
MRDAVEDDDYEEWAATAQRTLRQQYADYEKGLMAESGWTPEEAHRVAQQGNRDHWAVLSAHARSGQDGEMYEMSH